VGLILAILLFGQWGGYCKGLNYYLELSKSEYAFLQSSSLGQDSMYGGQKREGKSKQKIIGTLSVSIGRRRYFGAHIIMPFSENFFTTYGLEIAVRIYKSNYLRIAYDNGYPKFRNEYFIYNYVDSVLYGNEHLLSFEIIHKFTISPKLLYLICALGYQITSIEREMYYSENKINNNLLIGGIPWFVGIELYPTHSLCTLFLSFEIKHSPAIYGILDLLDVISSSPIQTIDLSLGLGYQFRR